MKQSFTQFNLSQPMLRAIGRMGFDEPTPVQAETIAPMMEGKDLIVQAPTGSGKTCAFGIPIVEAIDPASRAIQAVILCPTRELALQTEEVLRQLTACKEGVRVAAVYGGEPINRQILLLKRKPQILVATPGRMLDHMDRRTIRLDQVGQVVLDEADRMLDMGFRRDMDKILSAAPAERQTVLFSATLSNDIQKIAAQYQGDVFHVAIKQEALTVDSVTQFYTKVEHTEKFDRLQELIRNKEEGRMVVFVRTKRNAARLALRLAKSGFPALALHGDLQQSQRNRVMQEYRSGRKDVLVATDVAARGLDVDDVATVINFDLPDDTDSYVHRIGRTGRAGQRGTAYSFIQPDEDAWLHEIVRATNADIKPLREEDTIQPLKTGKRIDTSPGAARRRKPPQRQANQNQKQHAAQPKQAQRGGNASRGKKGAQQNHADQNKQNASRQNQQNRKPQAQNTPRNQQGSGQGGQANRAKRSGQSRQQYKPWDRQPPDRRPKQSGLKHPTPSIF